MEQQKLTKEQEVENVINQAIDIAIAKGCYKKEDLVVILNALAHLKIMITPIVIERDITTK